LAKLPRWAIVAFAARCAIRVRPLFEATWPEAPESYGRIVDRAIAAAASASETAGSTVGADIANSAYRVAATNEYRDAASGANVAYAACNAASAARAARAASNINSVTHAAHAYADATTAVSNSFLRFRYDYNVSENFLYAVRRDYDLLLACATEEKWTDDTPVPQAFFGPLWALGEAPDWAGKEEPNWDSEIVVQIEVPDDASDAEVVAAVTELVGRLNKLDRAYGGHGLEVSQLDIHGEVFVPQEVLQ